MKVGKYGNIYGHTQFEDYIIFNILKIWVRSRRSGCLATWFCYLLIANSGNKTATPPWPDSFIDLTILNLNIVRNTTRDGQPSHRTKLIVHSLSLNKTTSLSCLHFNEVWEQANITIITKKVVCSYTSYRFHDTLRVRIKLLPWALRLPSKQTRFVDMKR